MSLSASCLDFAYSRSSGHCNTTRAKAPQLHHTKMASNDPGFAPIADVTETGQACIEPEGFPNHDRPVAPDQFDRAYETTRKEIWAYYAYYIGDNGLTLFNFAPTAFQNLLSQAAGDSEVLHFAGGDRTINSIVLLANGISFAIQIVVFLVIGSYAGMYLSLAL